ncbi:MAG: DUF1285 domain-containing protein [Pseudomonadota bacterium]
MNTSQVQSILGAASRASKPAPVDEWDPPVCGEIDIRIAADGTWYHEGRPFARKRIPELFARLLRKDADGLTYLVTPSERLSIQVDDAPLIVTAHEKTGAPTNPTLLLRTNMADVFEVGEKHPLRFENEGLTGGLKPYVRVRGRIEALINRATAHAIFNDDDLVRAQGDALLLTSGSYSVAIRP